MASCRMSTYEEPSESSWNTHIIFQFHFAMAFLKFSHTSAGLNLIFLISCITLDARSYVMKGKLQTIIRFISGGKCAKLAHKLSKEFIWDSISIENTMLEILLIRNRDSQQGMLYPCSVVSISLYEYQPLYKYIA